MHSRIFQITTEYVQKEEYISESDFWEHWFVGNIADYVSDDVDRAEEILNLRQYFESMKVAEFSEDNSFKLLTDGKVKYFKTEFKRFSESVKKAADVNLEEFASGAKCEDLVFNIKSSYCDKFGWYVSSEEFGTIPMDEFIRSAEPGKRYYIGGVLDYHW